MGINYRQRHGHSSLGIFNWIGSFIGVGWLCIGGCDLEESDMATKPVTPVTQWATDATYSAGPDIGSPTKVSCSTVAPQGHIPGLTNPSAGQHMNDWQNEVSTLCAWVEAGSSLGAADAHIVETNASGVTSLAALTINGNPSLPSSLDITRQGSTSQAVLVNAGAGNGTITIGGNGITQVSVSAATGMGAFYGTVSGNAVPYQAAPQTTHPTVGATHDGGFGFEANSSLGSPNPTRMFAVIGGVKRYIPIYDLQFVRLKASSAGPHVFNVAIGSRITAIGPVDFPQWSAPQTGGIPLLYEISFEYSSINSTADWWVALYNNGTLIRRHFMSLHGQTTIQQGYVRGEISGAASLLGNDFTVEMYKVSGGGDDVNVENVILTIETDK